MTAERVLKTRFVGHYLHGIPDLVINDKKIIQVKRNLKEFRGRSNVYVSATTDATSVSQTRPSKGSIAKRRRNFNTPAGERTLISSRCNEFSGGSEQSLPRCRHKDFFARCAL